MRAMPRLRVTQPCSQHSANSVAPLKKRRRRNLVRFGVGHARHEVPSGRSRPGCPCANSTPPRDLPADRRSGARRRSSELPHSLAVSAIAARFAASGNDRDSNKSPVEMRRIADPSAARMKTRWRRSRYDTVLPDAGVLHDFRTRLESSARRFSYGASAARTAATITSASFSSLQSISPRLCVTATKMRAGRWNRCRNEYFARHSRVQQQSPRHSKR